MKRTLRDIGYAVAKIDAYREFMNYRVRNIVFHVLTLVLVSMLVTIAPIAAVYARAGGLDNIIREYVPEFKVSKDGFWIEHPVEIDEYNVYVNVNSDVVRDDIFDLNGAYGTYDNVIMIDKEQYYIKSMGTQEFSGRFSDGELALSREDMIKTLPVVYMLFLWFFVLTFLMNFGFYLLTSLATSWIAGVIASFMKLRIGGGRLFKMAVYAGTTSFLLENVFGLIRPTGMMTYFGYLISLGYMYFALRDIKDSMTDAAA